MAKIEGVKGFSDALNRLGNTDPDKSQEVKKNQEALTKAWKSLRNTAEDALIQQDGLRLLEIFDELKGLVYFEDKKGAARMPTWAGDWFDRTISSADFLPSLKKPENRQQIIAKLTEIAKNSSPTNDSWMDLGAKTIDWLFEISNTDEIAGAALKHIADTATNETLRNKASENFKKFYEHSTFRLSGVPMLVSQDGSGHIVVSGTKPGGIPQTYANRLFVKDKDNRTTVPFAQNRQQELRASFGLLLATDDEKVFKEAHRHLSTLASSIIQKKDKESLVTFLIALKEDWLKLNASSVSPERLTMIDGLVEMCLVALLTDKGSIDVFLSLPPRHQKFAIETIETIVRFDHRKFMFSLSGASDSVRESARDFLISMARRGSIEAAQTFGRWVANREGPMVANLLALARRARSGESACSNTVLFEAAKAYLSEKKHYNEQDPVLKMLVQPTLRDWSIMARTHELPLHVAVTAETVIRGLFSKDPLIREAAVSSLTKLLIKSMSFSLSEKDREENRQIFSDLGLYEVWKNWETNHPKDHFKFTCQIACIRPELVNGRSIQKLFKTFLKSPQILAEQIGTVPPGLRLVSKDPLTALFHALSESTKRSNLLLSAKNEVLDPKSPFRQKAAELLCQWVNEINVILRPAERKEEEINERRTDLKTAFSDTIEGLNSQIEKIQTKLNRSSKNKKLQEQLQAELKFLKDLKEMLSKQAP